MAEKRVRETDLAGQLLVVPAPDGVVEWNGRPILSLSYSEVDAVNRFVSSNAEEGKGTAPLAPWQLALPLSVW